MTDSEKMAQWVLGGPNGDCHVWNGSLGGPTGYRTPMTILGGKQQSAVRFSFMMANPDFDMKGHITHRTCGNGLCINPAHMVAHTRKTMPRKGRATRTWVHGASVIGAILNDEQVLEMRQLHSDGASCKGLAAQFGVSYSTANKIVRRESWKHI